FRPGTGQLYGLTAHHLYTLDLPSGRATLVGDPSADLGLGGDEILSSFDPVADAIREITVEEAPAPGSAPAHHTRLLTPPTAAVTDDAMLNVHYVTGDINSRVTLPELDALAYTNQAAGASGATLYAFDQTSGFLATLGGVNGNPPPDTGQLFSVGPLAGGNALTVGGPDNDAFVVQPADPTSPIERLFTVDLSTGHRYLHIFGFLVESVRMDSLFQAWMLGCRSGISGWSKRT